MQAAQWLERSATATGLYQALPDALRKVPSDTYTIAAKVPDGLTFSLTATPQNNQTGDRCGTFTLNNAGERSTSSGTAPPDECWGR
ncbi:MAG: type IV pilin protein [Desulfovibrionaceae bacterium]|nr:type IV pilin protein [Desulfovibrionaceae bacterium]